MSQVRQVAQHMSNSGLCYPLSTFALSLPLSLSLSLSTLIRLHALHQAQVCFCRLPERAPWNSLLTKPTLTRH